MIRKLLFLLLSYSCNAQDGSDYVKPAQYDLSNMPPRDSSLIFKDAQQQDRKKLHSIKRLVDKALQPKKEPRSKEIKLKNQQLVQQSIHQDLITMIDAVYADPELEAKKVTLSMKASQVQDLLRALAQAAGITLVVDADVTGNVKPMHFEKVPLAAALKSIVSSHTPRLVLFKEHAVWRVMTFKTAHEYYAGRAAYVRGLLYHDHAIVMEHAVWNDDFKKRVEKIWQGIVGPQEKDKTYLVFDDPNHKVLFKAHNDHAARFGKVLHEMNIKLPQVRLDARVVLADKNFEESLGFNWSGVYNRRASIKRLDFAGLGPVQKDTGNGADKDTPFKNIVGWALNFIPSTVKNTINIPFVFGNKDFNTKRLNIELAAAEGRSEIKTILKPSLLVHNQEQAEILVGQELPLETRVDEAIEGKLTNLTTVNYKDTGMRLKVKPSIAPDRETVFLDMFVENSSITQLDQGNQVGTNNSKFNYTIQTARTNNRVLLRSGETTMIGGLITNVDEGSESGVPILSKIPVLGRLFSWQGKKKAEKQMLIFITPTLVDV